jgi:hypothetical protein
MIEDIATNMVQPLLGLSSKGEDSHDQTVDILGALLTVLNWNT